MRNLGNLVIALIVAVAALLVLVPVGYLLLGAVSTSIPGQGAAFGLTAQHLKQAYLSRAYLFAAYNTLKISVLVTLISVGVGGMLAWITARTDTPMRKGLELLIIIPNFLSPLAGAMAWVLLAAPKSGMINVLAQSAGLAKGPIFDIFSISGIVWVMSLFYIPYAYLYTVGALQNMDPSLEEAAAMTGAGIWVTMRRVTLPLMKPALVSAALLVGILSMEMFSIPGLLGGPTGQFTLSYRIFLATRFFPPQYQLAAAASTMLLVVTLLGIFYYRRLTAASKRFVTITGKGYRPRTISLGRWRWATFAFASLYVLCSVILPYFAITLGAFTKYFTANVTSDMFTLYNFQKIASSGLVGLAVKNTLILSAAVPTVTVVVGVLAAFLIQRTKLKGRGLLDYLLSLPVAIPGITFGIALVWTTVRTPIYGTLLLLGLAYLIRYIPNALRTASTGLLQVHPDLEEAASTAGAPTWAVIKEITLPLLQPAMLSTWMLTFIIVVREISSSIVLYGSKSIVLSVLIWDFMESGEYQYACVLGLLQTVLILGVLIVARSFFGVSLSGQDASQSG